MAKTNSTLTLPTSETDSKLGKNEEMLSAMKSDVLNVIAKDKKVKSLKKTDDKSKQTVKPRKKQKIDNDEEDDEDFEDDRSVDDDDDVGSLVDFVVKDTGEDSDAGSDEDDKELTHEESRRRDLEDIDASNIIMSGKRTRKAPTRYEEEVFASEAL